MKDQARQMRRRMTIAEKTVWQALAQDRCEGLRFRRQEVLDQYIADFYCPSLKLVLEIDGQSHDTEEAQKRDRERTESLFEARGLRVIRLRNEFVRVATHAEIREAVRQAIAKL